MEAPTYALRGQDPVEIWQALEDGATICVGCSDAFAERDELCGDCWNEINGQFGVGA